MPGMTNPAGPVDHDDDDDIVALLERAIAGIKSGQIQRFTLRVKLKDGTVQDLQFGYETEAERDAAMARLLKLINELH
jgi:hypothetical protein